MGLAKGRVNGLDRHVRQTDNRVLEVLVDPNAGTVAEVNLAEDGKLRQRTVYGYAELPDRRVWVRHSTRVEIAAKDGSGEPSVIEHSLSNIRLERRGATP